jgi:hypothetical protein
MGEVYRARDPRLSRDVAIKVLPAASVEDPDSLRRFEQEARAAAALNHPNILDVHDFGVDGDVQYVVSELLVGRTLREVLSSGPLPLPKTIDYAVQIATGLASAHEEGIVHRDLKPENLFVTRDGRVKILDFGLAKLTARGAAAADVNLQMTQVGTIAGLVLGTAGYMAPEQVRGLPIDQRTDIFAFGVVVYEMLSGHRLFNEPSAIETMSAVVTKEPPDLAALGPSAAPLTRIIRRCLEKQPENRFQSARDLAFALEGIAAPPPSGALPARRKASRRRLTYLATGAGALAIAVALGASWALRTARPPELSFRRLTFQRGTVRAARFAADGRTIVYSATWSGNASRVFVTHTDTRESTSPDLPAGDVAATTSTGEVILLVGRNQAPTAAYISSGTLARAAQNGGGVRELVEGVDEADASADGSTFAIVRTVGERHRLEFPAGSVVYETTGYISSPRLSPRGDRVAFLDHPVQNDDRGVVAVVDRAGKRTTLTREWIGEQGLAWAPDGREIWFDAGPGDEPRTIYAVDLEGRLRLVYRAPRPLKLEDVGRDGRVLLSGEDSRMDIIGASAGDTRERDLSWFHLQAARALSADGGTLIFSWLSGFDYATYMRKTDGSAAVRLGDGYAQDLSPDGKWVIATSFSAPDRLTVLPTGPGQPKIVALGSIKFDGSTTAQWTRDGSGIVFAGVESGRRARTYRVRLAGEAPVAITPEGIAGTLLSPDGSQLVVRADDGRPALFDVGTGRTRELAGALPAERVLGWDATGRAVYVCVVGAGPVQVFRLEVAGARRHPVLQLTPSDRTGVISGVIVTPDGRFAVYNVHRRTSELFVVTGLR